MATILQRLIRLKSWQQMLKVETRCAPVITNYIVFTRIAMGHASSAQGLKKCDKKKGLSVEGRHLETPVLVRNAIPTHRNVAESL